MGEKTKVDHNKINLFNSWQPLTTPDVRKVNSTTEHAGYTKEGKCIELKINDNKNQRPYEQVKWELSEIRQWKNRKKEARNLQSTRILPHEILTATLFSKLPTCPCTSIKPLIGLNVDRINQLLQQMTKPTRLCYALCNCHKFLEAGAITPGPS